MPKWTASFINLCVGTWESQKIAVDDRRMHCTLCSPALSCSQWEDIHLKQVDDAVLSYFILKSIRTNAM